MSERVCAPRGLVDPGEKIKDFKGKCVEMAKDLNTDPENLKKLIAATGILVFEARVNGDTRVEITFDEQGLPTLKGYKEKVNP